MKVLPILQQAFPTTSGYENIITVVQANAEGHLVKIQYAGNDVDAAFVRKSQQSKCDDLMPTITFVKTVNAAKYATEKKSWADLRRTLMYCRTEVRFYKDILPKLQTSATTTSLKSSSPFFFANATPQIFFAQYDLEGLLTEEEGATDPSGVGPVSVDWMTTIDDSKPVQSAKGGFLVMEGISPEEYFQDSPITIEQAKQTLAAVAGLHAAAWEDQAILIKAEKELSRGSYNLKTRNPKELTGLSEAWSHFVEAFRELDTRGIFETCGADFGQRIQSLAEYVCEKTSPGPTDAYATLSHGDFKAMNCFLPALNNSSSQKRGVVMVDFASIGVGLGMQDVAMHIHHAVKPSDLETGGEMLLVDHYLTVLNDLLQRRQKYQSYPRDVALQHYQLAVVDYFRFLLGRFWNSATPESFAKNADSKNTALMNRDVDAAFAFLERVETYVAQIEVQRENDGLCRKWSALEASQHYLGVR